MKINLVPILATVILLSSCNQEAERQQKRLAYTLDSLTMVASAKDSTINDLLFSFNDIKQNLDSVALMQNIISTEVETPGGKFVSNTKDRINSQISSINNLLNQNKAKIAELNRKLKNNSLKINEFQKMIASLNDDISAKNMELQTLNEKLNSANTQMAQLQTSIDTLSNTSATQSKLIADQIASIHTAYYLVGKSKEMEKMKIINKTGGVLGMGKTPKLNADVNKSNFTQIDYTQVLSIPINSKKAKVITTHPSDSYMLDKENGEYTNLRIIQPDKFWSTSKYLAVLND
ncbi:MAG: hypothetical protein V4547_05465 [Bacteroidota bacterium]